MKDKTLNILKNGTNFEQWVILVTFATICFLRCSTPTSCEVYLVIINWTIKVTKHCRILLIDCIEGKEPLHALLAVFISA